LSDAVLGRDRVLAICEPALAGAGEVEIFYAGGRGGTTRFADGAIIQSEQTARPLTQVRVRVAGRIGVARGGELSAPHLGHLIARARAQAQALASAPEDPRFAEPASTSAALGFADATAALDSGGRAEVVARLIARATGRGCALAGGFRTSVVEWAVASTTGVRAWHRMSHAKLELIASRAGASGYATFYGRDIAGLDAAGLCESACERAHRGQHPLELLPGRYDVVLEPPAVVECLEWLAMTGFSARALADGQSFLERPGERITSEGVTWHDDANAGCAGVPGLPFDCEGVPKQAVALVEHGRAGTPCFDLRTAASASTGSTGHAAPPSDDAPAPLATHIVMAAGTEPRARLLERLGRGLVVTRFHYVNGLLEPRRALQTGMTRDGLFWVENGRVRAGVRNLRFTEPMLEAFARMECASQERQAVAATGGFGYVAPAVLIRGFQFTGNGA
jgi:predicted Zn-dependent protease